MPKKRGNNEGTISKRKDGTWCAAITTGTGDDGRQKRKFLYGKTRKEVAEKLNQAIHSVNLGIFVEPNKVTVKEWLNAWLFDYKRPTIRPSTFQDYEYLIRVHITPAIGKTALKDLRTEHIQKLYNDKSAAGQVNGGGGLSPSSVRHIHIVLHEALEQAVKNNLLIRNVSEATTLPKLKKHEMRVLTISEQQTFLRSLEGERLIAAFILAMGSGVREGELLALRWQDVDFEKGIIRIRQTMKRVRVFDENSPTKTKIIFSEPKTESGKRSVPLPESVIVELKAHRKRQLVEKIAAREIYQDSGLVFVTELGGPLEPRNFLRKFYKLLKKAGLDHFNFHALRHTYATRLLEANEHPKVVQEILGHSDISLTLNTYSHVLPDLKKAAADKLDHLFQQKSPSKTEEHK